MQVDPRKALLVKPPDDEKVHVTLERGSGVAAVTSVLPRSIQIDARCETDCALRVGQYYYPAWRVRAAQQLKSSCTPGLPGGLMEMSLPAGEYHLVLEVPHRLPEQLGAWLSLACVLIVLVIAIAGTPFLHLAPMALRGMPCTPSQVQPIGLLRAGCTERTESLSGAAWNIVS